MQKVPPVPGITTDIAEAAKAVFAPDGPLARALPDFEPRAAEQQQRERQQRLRQADDDPASDANTESANHPNDE